MGKEFIIGINELVYPSSCGGCGVEVIAEIIGEDLHMRLMDILGEEYERKEHKGFVEFSSDSGRVRVLMVEEPEEPYEDFSYLLFVQKW